MTANNTLGHLTIRRSLVQMVFGIIGIVPEASFKLPPLSIRICFSNTYSMKWSSTGKHFESVGITVTDTGTAGGIGSTTPWILMAVLHSMGFTERA
jgi:hypothetical protein